MFSFSLQIQHLERCRCRHSSHRNRTNGASTRGIIERLAALEATVSLMRRRLVRKFGSLIGLLAILMSVLAPAVSQALASGAHAETILSAYCSAASQTQAEKHTPSQHSAAGHWDACGYCNFAAHSPAGPPSSHTPQRRLAAKSLATNAPVQSIAPYAPVFAAQPRAPPFSA